MKSGDAQLLASGSDVLSCQHSSVWGRLVTIGLDLHTTSNSADGFAAAGITQVSLCFFPNLFVVFLFRPRGVDLRKISDMDKGIVEGSENSCDAKDKLACEYISPSIHDAVHDLSTFADLWAEGDVLLGWAGCSFLGWHVVCCLKCTVNWERRVAVDDSIVYSKWMRFFN